MGPLIVALRRQDALTRLLCAVDELDEVKRGHLDPLRVSGAVSIHPPVTLDPYSARVRGVDLGGGFVNLFDAVFHKA